MAKKILMIDDDADVRSLIKIRLEANGFNIILASDGDEGLKAIEKEKPDLVIVDIRMPKMDGYTLVREIKSRSSTGSVPIMILTSHAGMKDLFAAEGIEDYITKPFDPDELLQKIHKRLN
ncbi:MAG: response regulator [Candidatus Omnitrophica bacterium]|nr:response regulator [Candidatus Omnitrophota bacterium]